MTSDDDETEPTLAAIEEASEAVQTANHAAYRAPATPESLYGRTAALVELLGRLRQVAFTLGNQVERAPSDAMKGGQLLDTDDGISPSEYVHEARRLLADAAAGAEAATRAVDQAHSALSHLKLVDP
jgi:hypothetical protein